MRKIWRGLRWAGLVLLLVGAYGIYRIVWGHPFTINQLANRQAIFYLLDNPELLTQIGIVDGTLLDRHSGRLAAVGVAKRDADYAYAQTSLDEVRRFDRQTLRGQDQITYDVLVDYYGSSLAFRRFDWLSSEGLYPIGPMFGTQAQLIGFMQSAHVIKNDKSARNYVARLQAMGGKLDALTADMQRQARLGVVLPPSLLSKTLTVIDDTIEPSPEKNALITSFAERMRSAGDISPELQSQLHAAAVTALTTQVYPAYRRMRAAVLALTPLSASQSAGVSRLPDGAAYYAASLRLMTTTDYTPEQLHALGLSEVTRIAAEMDVILKAQGMADGSVAERLKILHDDPRFLLPNTDAGRKKFLARFDEILREVNARMPQYFRTVPQSLPSVQRMAVATEMGAAAAQYVDGAMDGSRPGIFFVNERDLHETPSFTMKTLAYHEGIPGHHFQITIAQGLTDLPFLRQQGIYTAYVEGWALYAERFAAEIGMYKDDPLGDLGRLQGEIFRAARLVVDTGLHAKGWSREQAISYMVNETGMGEREVTSEVERYMALPGQACAYKVGQLKILELREKARAALGDKFSIKDFHTVILENGALPLTILQRLVDEWIEKTRLQTS